MIDEAAKAKLRRRLEKGIDALLPLLIAELEKQETEEEFKSFNVWADEPKEECMNLTLNVKHWPILVRKQHA